MSTWRPAGILLAILLLAVSGGFSLGYGDASAAPPPPHAAAQPNFDTGRVIVKFRAGVPAATQSAVHRGQNASVVDRLGNTGMVVVQVPNARATQAIAAAYARNPNVAFAEADALVPLADTGFTPNDPLYPNQWQHGITDSELAWSATTGSSNYLITICDTGFKHDHADLQGNLRWDLRLNTASGNQDASPVHPHGTFVAGMAAAVGNNATGVAGVAHTAGIVPVRISNSSNGSAFISHMAACILYGSGETVNGHSIGSASTAINLSYQTYSNGTIFPALLSAAQTATDNGSLVVFAAGNENTKPVGEEDPDEILYVAAIDSDGTRSSFSNYGPFIDIAAPGNSVVSTYYSTSCRGPWNCTVNDAYASGSGTSYAAPMVTGAALLVQANAGGSLSPMAIKAALTGGACEAGDPNQYGAGILNTNNAVRGLACGEAPDPPDEPTLVSISISTDDPTTVDIDGEVQFTATGTYSDGSSEPLAGVSWNSSNTSVVTIDSSGLATAVGLGSADITASFDGVTSDSSTVTVNAPPPPDDPPPGVQLAGLTNLGSANNGSSWTANVRVSVTSGGSPQSGVNVSYQWNGGAIQLCTTNSNGHCDLDQPGLHKRVGSITLTVTNLAHGGENHDPGAQNSITVSKP